MTVKELIKDLEKYDPDLEVASKIHDIFGITVRRITYTKFLEIENLDRTKDPYEYVVLHDDTVEDYVTQQLKALDIIHFKRVDTFYLKRCFNRGDGLERYNKHAQKFNIGILKEEEYALLEEELKILRWEDVN